jgi:predicted small metal-binding protein
MTYHLGPMGLRAECPKDGCEYIAFGDDEKQLKRDLLYHLMDCHGVNYIPDETVILEDISKV